MKANPVSETRNSAPSDVKQGDDKWIRYNLDGDAVINFDDTRTAHHAAQRWTTLSDLLREGDGDAPSVRIARAAAEPQTEKRDIKYPVRDPRPQAVLRTAWCECSFHQNDRHKFTRR